MTKLDRRRQYYLILDCETATLPFVKEFSEHDRKKIAIAKPLIYDLGWQIVDVRGRVYKRVSYLITEIFSVPQVFDTAYYREKRPIYLDRLAKGETSLVSWATATAELVEDIQAVASVGAYNSMFDCKKAIPFTELYISKVLSPDYWVWEQEQRKWCEKILHGGKSPRSHFEKDFFRFRGIESPMFDLWGLACKELLCNDDFREWALSNGLVSPSGKFFSTTAETCYRFLKRDMGFVESHTAIDDAEIETEIFAEITKRVKHDFVQGLIYFPFRILGRVERYEERKAIGDIGWGVGL